MSTIINQPPPFHQYSLLWVATPSATFHAKFLDQRLVYIYSHTLISYSDPLHAYQEHKGIIEVLPYPPENKPPLFQQ